MRLRRTSPRASSSSSTSAWHLAKPAQKLSGGSVTLLPPVNSSLDLLADADRSSVGASDQKRPQP